MPESLAITPWTSVPQGVKIRPPGSKSLTNRALAIAAWATGRSVLTGALECDDTRVMVQALRSLGIAVEWDTETAVITVDGCGGVIPADNARLFLGNSGTSLRFLAALVATGKGVYCLDGVHRMRQRPIGDLVMAINRLGADARSDLTVGYPPITINADGLDGGYTSVKGDISSQFLSGLLMALPYAREKTRVDVEGELVSRPYVDMTLHIMEAFGNISVINRKYQRFDITPGKYHSRTFAIEPDASAASYFLALAAITGGSVTIEGLGRNSVQGDIAFADVLQYMGCTLDQTGDSTTIQGGNLHGVDVDMNAISDTVMTLAVVALFAEGVTRIRNVAHIRHKETDRLAALSQELRKLGAVITEHPDGLVIIPPSPNTNTPFPPAEIATYDDHRMAMSFALAGIRSPGITIQNPQCVAKTYPRFWDDLARVRASAESPATP